MIQVVDIGKSFGDRVLFENVTFSLNRGERIGLVGRNGSGKSTLFKILLGEELSDTGAVTIPKGYKLGTLKQHIEFSKESVIAECMSVLDKEFEYETYRAEKLLFGLGFVQGDMEKDPWSFSGGYQIRINLVKTLLSDPNCLLLDEPTNYLDIVSLRWLRGFLKSFDGEVVIITHDREFMNTVITHTMGINRKSVKKIKGQTEKYYEQVIEEEKIYEQTRMNQEKKVQQMMSYVDKVRASARGAASAQSKLKMIDKMTQYDQLEAIDDLEFSFSHTQCPGKIVMDVRGVSFGFNEPLFEKVKFSILRSDRIGIIGKNGKGKSTFLNTLAGIHTPFEGEIWKHAAYRPGHFGQTNVNRLHDSNTIIQEILEENSDLSISKVRNICGTMMFSGDQADKKISVLSGGEKARVLLAKILARKTNLLLLDEPTNHLDMESVEALTEAIDKYDGACLVVTHSEAILRKCINKLVIFREGHAEFFDGTYDEFLDKIGWDSEEDQVEKEKKVEVVYKQKKSGNVQKIEIEEEKIMEQIETLEKYQGMLESSLEKHSISGDVDKLRSTTSQLEEVHTKIEDLFVKLEELHA